MGRIKEHYVTSKTDPMFVGHLEAENEIYRQQIELVHKENDDLRKEIAVLVSYIKGAMQYALEDDMDGVKEMLRMTGVELEETE